MSAPETEEAVVGYDEEYYAELTQQLGLRVEMMEGKGKGVVATRAYKKGEEVLKERALAAVQNADEWSHIPGSEGATGVQVCGLTLRSLESVRGQWARVAPEGADCPDLPSESEYHYPHALEASACAPAGGVELPRPALHRYISTEAAEEAWDRYGRSVDPEVMTPEGKEALREWAAEGWVQGGVDYSDTFALALQYFCIAACSIRKGESPEQAWKPFKMLISCPWERFRFGYLTRGEEVATGPTKAEFIVKGVRLLRAILGDAAAELATEHRLSRTLGCVLLNGQERSPTSPWDDYVEWLSAREEGGRKSAKALRKRVAELKLADTLQYSSRGQATYRVGACFNHSCAPNIEVGYCTEQDETLVVTAVADIAQGDELCISYIEESAELSKRQETLLEHYLFQCKCTKCVEEGVGTSSEPVAPPAAAPAAVGGGRHLDIPAGRGGGRSPSPSPRRGGRKKEAPPV